MLQLIFRMIGFLILFFSPAEKVFSNTFAEIIAFGDSLTDVGNVAGLTKPGVAPVINGYYKKTHFCDFIIWVETTADFLHLPPRTPGRGSSTSLPPLPDGNTWAWGGSEAAAGSVKQEGVSEPIPNLLLEVDQYLAVHTPKVNTLYSIWSGADNLLIGDHFTPKYADQAVQAIESAIRRLADRGASNFLIFNMPSLSDTPAARSGGVFDEVAANLYTNAFNKALYILLAKLHKDPSLKIYFVNVFKELNKVVRTVKRGKVYRPNFFVPGPPVAISNVTDEGLNYFNAHGTFPKNYLFWDDVHPTTQGHQVVAGLVLQAIHA